ncbi:MAG TPA: hypothetical protein VJ937_00750 [Salinivirga sp.]|uniref:DUF6922 domain-containing protein n=1 Tax=Salinivirga sp. TaxID=1970192 RepID=UPI002B46F9DA|nr:hypothetical protein [Salinivirga sp.]HKK57978.1 hypothetical protein [Salinivirga sp.]
MNDKNISSKDFSPHLFWDVDVETLDLEKHKAYVIRRAMEYGKIKDWNLLKTRYSMDEIKDAIISARSIDPKVISFVALLTNTPLNSFRCYTNQQSNPSFYGY